MTGIVSRALTSTALVAAAACLVASPALSQTSPWVTPEYNGSGVLALIHAAQAYEQGFTGAGVLVGVMDTGIDARHPEFLRSFTEGWDTVTRQPILLGENGESDAADSHGTHVSGLIAAARDGIGMQGVAFNASITVADAIRAGGNLAEGMDYLFETRRVAIYNGSYGADCDLGPCFINQFTRQDIETSSRIEEVDGLRSAVRHNVLIVMAAGNDSSAQPSIEAGYPTLFPELEPNYLVVVATDSKGVLADYSNQCGVTMAFCLAAPGTSTSTVTLGTGTGPYNGYKELSGTSMAAPLVSGVAALVKEAFPWASANDLQQILLTTATDLGAPGVDPVYGHGMLNAAKAVRGYGAFDREVVIDTAGGSGVFSNDITGAGGLVKAGAGTLLLTGANLYTGGTLVREGILSVNGSVVSPVAVEAGGTLRGTGTIGSSLRVAGRLAPGNSPGTLTVAGPVTFASGSVFQADIDGTGTANGRGNYSRLLVTGTSGTVSIQGGTLLPVMRGISGDATNAYVAPLGSSYTVIQANGGIAGSFTTLAQPAAGLPAFTRFDALYAPTSLSLVVTPLSYGALARNGLFSTANTNATGAALDSIRPGAGTPLSGIPSGLFTALYATAPGSLPNALAQLSGEAYASAAAQTFDDARLVRNAVLDRLGGIAGAPAGTPGVALAPGLNIAVWATGYGGWGNASGPEAYGLGWSQAGFMAGADASVFDTTRIGLAIGTGQSNGTVDALNSSIINSHTDLAAYGTSRFGGLVAKYALAYSWTSLDLGRNVAFGGLGNTLSGESSGHTVQAVGELSYGFGLGAAQIAPFANVAYVRQTFGDVQEIGGAAALAGGPQNMDTTLTTLGVQLSTDVALGAGRLTPSARIGWQHAFGDTDTAATLWFAGSSPFTVAGVPIATDALALNVALGYAFNGTVSAGIAYDGLLSGDSQASAIKANMKVAF